MESIWKRFEKFGRNWRSLKEFLWFFLVFKQGEGQIYAAARHWASSRPARPKAGARPRALQPSQGPGAKGRRAPS
ncbi:hypothetical protein TIFTF001_015220 [Ficus carica]|uniref:Uncharacterized protein n=1 Tax=Ficus carica TaxID=3494 RepID=A0AA87ZYA9_FICCA|nr:hypothetical protein TIFTF001_015220 [Ficus carica]